MASDVALHSLSVSSCRDGFGNWKGAPNIPILFRRYPIGFSRCSSTQNAMGTPVSSLDFFADHTDDLAPQRQNARTRARVKARYSMRPRTRPRTGWT